MDNISFILNDFLEVFDGYDLKKPCIILNKAFDIKPVNIISRNIKIQDFILRVNIYLGYLNNCKDEILSSFYEIVNSLTYESITLEDIVNNNWYEELRIEDVLIYIHEKEIASRIYCFDKNNDRLEIYMHDNIIEIKYYNDMGFYTDFIRNINADNNDSNIVTDNINKNICRIHKCNMEKMKVKIQYGLPIGPIIGYTEARELIFPNCDDFILGGCCISENSQKYKKKYVCDLCNKSREEWKLNHSSEMFFELNYNIKNNVIIILNNEKQYLIEKNNMHNNYWVKIIAIPNGKYNIIAKDKITKEIYSSVEIELNNECISLYVEKNDNKISFDIGKKHELWALWN